MTKKTIYLVQAGYPFAGRGEKKGYFIPYAAGTLVAFAQSQPLIRDTYAFKDILYRFDDIETSAAVMDNPYLVGFSNYVWNFEYNKRFAKHLKMLYPHCRIVFGGHHIPPDSSVLNDCPYVDFLIHGEGEEPFAALLLALAANDSSVETVSNLSYRNADNVAVKTPDHPSNRTDYPSPYLTGVFERLLDNEDVDFFAIVETNRGCPFRCTYCDWGISKTGLKVFPEQRLREEVRWIADHAIDYCFAADANFGILDRDETIADALITSKQTTGYPSRFDVTYSKGREDIVFRIAKKMFDARMFRGPSVSLQTLNPQALDNIGRHNMTLDSYAGLLARYKEAGIPAYSEMILGLPGETYESFCRGIGTLLELGQHNYIDIFRCELLPNAPMSTPGYKEKHRIKTIRTPSVQHHIPPRKGEVHGYSDIVVETATMSAEQWLQANMFALLVQSCHHMGLLKYVAIYLHRTRHTAYDGFYNALLSWLECAKETFTGGIFASMKRVYENFLASGTELSYVNPVFGNLTWFPEEGAFLELARSSDAFYADMRAFLKKFIADKNLLDDLLVFQQGVIKQPEVQERVLSLRYDWAVFFAPENEDDIEGPRLASNRLFMPCPDTTHTWEEYARENVWFGRRAGKTVYFEGACGKDTEYAG